MLGDGCRVPVLVLGAGRQCWCCELVVHAVAGCVGVRMVETGCRCWVPGAGAGAVSWLCTC